jgi:hypothetical protein
MIGYVMIISLLILNRFEENAIDFLAQCCYNDL